MEAADCPVCTEPVTDSSVAPASCRACSRAFHLACLHAALAVDSRCPLCREELATIGFNDGNTVTRPVRRRLHGDFEQMNADAGELDDVIRETVEVFRDITPRAVLVSTRIGVEVKKIAGIVAACEDTRRGHEGRLAAILGRVGLVAACEDTRRGHEGRLTAILGRVGRIGCDEELQADIRDLRARFESLHTRCEQLSSIDGWDLPHWLIDCVRRTQTNVEGLECQFNRCNAMRRRVLRIVTVIYNSRRPVRIATARALRRPAAVTRVLRRPAAVTRVLRRTAAGTRVLRRPAAVTRVLRRPSASRTMMRRRPATANEGERPATIARRLAPPS